MFYFNYTGQLNVCSRRSQSNVLASCFSKLMTDNILPHARNVKGKWHQHSGHSSFILFFQNKSVISKICTNCSSTGLSIKKMTSDPFASLVPFGNCDTDLSSSVAGLLFKHPDYATEALAYIERCWAIFQSHCKAILPPANDESMTCRDMLWLFKVG